MKFLRRLFGKKKKDRSWERVAKKLDELPTMEIEGKKFCVIDSQDESIPKVMGEALGIQFVEDSAVEYLNRGNNFREKGRHQEAMKEYTSAIKIEPNYVDAHHSIALNYLSMKHFDDALKEFRQTLILAEQFVPKKARKDAIEMIVANICTLFRKKGLNQNSIADFMNIVKTLNNPPPMYHCAIGLLYEDLDLKNKAINEYEKLLLVEKTSQWANLAHERINHTMAKER